MLASAASRRRTRIRARRRNRAGGSAEDRERVLSVGGTILRLGLDRRGRSSESASHPPERARERVADSPDRGAARPTAGRRPRVRAPAKHRLEVRLPASTVVMVVLVLLVVGLLQGVLGAVLVLPLVAAD
jgi:hypothetical protein